MTNGGYLGFQGLPACALVPGKILFLFIVPGHCMEEEEPVRVLGNMALTVP